MSSPSRSGAFDAAVDRRVERFSESISFDQRLFRQDIAGSIAHAQMLTDQSILTPEAKRRLFSEMDANEKEIDDLYSTLIGLIQEGSYLEGQGNLGQDGDPPADPLFTECWLTEQGRQLVKRNPW